jgi:hypothetical protein
MNQPALYAKSSGFIEETIAGPGERTMLRNAQVVLPAPVVPKTTMGSSYPE